jgi:hypothetical protein
MDRIRPPLDGRGCGRRERTHSKERPRESTRTKMCPSELLKGSRRSVIGWRFPCQSRLRRWPRHSGLRSLGSRAPRSDRAAGSDNRGIRAKRAGGVWTRWTEFPARSIRCRAGINEKAGPVGKYQEGGVATASLDLVDIERAGRPWVERLQGKRLSEARAGTEHREQKSALASIEEAAMPLRNLWRGRSPARLSACPSPAAANRSDCQRGADDSHGCGY